MDVERVITKLKEEYPGKNIIKLPDDNPTEIICETGPTIDHPEKSVAVAVIDKTKSHKHPNGIETYEVLKGTVSLYVNRKTYLLKPGETFVIKPGDVHSATANEAWVKVTSKPGWTPEDHVIDRF